MRLLRCDRHPDTEARFTFEVEEWCALTEDERRASLSPPGTKRYEGSTKVDLCAECAQELRSFLASLEVTVA